MSSFEFILTEVVDGVGVIRLNRPKALNALNNRMVSEIMDALEMFDANDQVGAIVITGDERAFAAGADIKEMSDASAVEMLVRDYSAPFNRIRAITKPIIAAVSGWCLGGGSELAMSCDMIVASETAKFGQPEINLGIIPGAGGTQRLTKAVGKALAMEMILNDRRITAEEAMQYGLVNRVVDAQSFFDEAMTLAKEISARAPLAVRLAKEAVNHAFESFLSDGLREEIRSFYILFASEDQKEGMQAFIEKRDAQWKGK
jgi:enoyl-CoA hydratase